MLMATNDAYKEGYDANWDGVDVSDNPYEEDTEEYRHWEDGWRSARKTIVIIGRSDHGPDRPLSAERGKGKPP
jgi:ribosome modulation factor